MHSEQMKKLWPEDRIHEFDDAAERSFMWIGATISTVFAAGIAISLLL